MVYRLVAICVAAMVFGATTNANAACQKLGFTVNDYGKIGPTNDAKKLLDKYIAEWTEKNGIKNYRKGKKTVTCELFLDFGFFDEYTCKAVASFCWDGPAIKNPKN